MTFDDEPPPDAEASELPPPKSPERKIMLWLAIVFGTTLMCLLMLAARAESPASLRPFFDIGIFACLLGVATFALVRFMFLYPFRLLDLLVMVITLALGMKGAIALADGMRHTQWGEVLAPALSNAPNSSSVVLYVEVCMLTACVLMAGAALGLRNCRTLNIGSPLKRAIVIVFGMATVPAPIGLIAIPLHLLRALMSEKQTSPDSLWWAAALIFSGITVVANFTFSIRGMALNTENATQESKWREK